MQSKQPLQIPSQSDAAARKAIRAFEVDEHHLSA